MKRNDEADALIQLSDNENKFHPDTNQKEVDKMGHISERLLSLDAFRGLVITGITIIMS